MSLEIYALIDTDTGEILRREMFTPEQAYSNNLGMNTDKASFEWDLVDRGQDSIDINRITTKVTKAGIEAEVLRLTGKSIVLIKGNGYYWISSNDDETSLYLAGLYTTSIPVCYLRHQSISGWIQDIISILRGEE